MNYISKEHHAILVDSILKAEECIAVYNSLRSSYTVYQAHYSSLCAQCSTLVQQCLEQYMQHTPHSPIPQENEIHATCIRACEELIRACLQYRRVHQKNTKDVLKAAQIFVEACYTFITAAEQVLEQFTLLKR